MEHYTTYLIRIWLPDRPGALGAVATRFGALKGDLIGFEILERGGGLAIDELVVTLPDSVGTDLVVKELNAEEGVKVEDIRNVDSLPYDPQVDVLEVASVILGAETWYGLAEALCVHSSRAIRSNWSCVVDLRGGVLASWGDCPNAAWLTSFVSGSPAIAGGEDEDVERVSTMDAVWVPLPTAGAALVVGRNGASDTTAIRAQERRRLAALARIADTWFHRVAETSRLQSWIRHPSYR